MVKPARLKELISALTVAGAGFILLNLTFIFYFLTSKVLEKIVIPGSTPQAERWFMPMSFTVSTALITLASWFVFRSRLAIVWKATFMTVPVAVCLVITGISLHTWPVLPYLVGGLITGGLLFYFYRIRQPWLYYYAVLLVAGVLLIMGITGAEI